MIGNKRYNFADSINILGFNLKRTGFSIYITKRLGMARATLTKLKRFKKLKPKTKGYLYKTLIRSAMEYPNVPSCVMSRTNRNKIQKCQNNTIRRYIHVNVDEKARNENIEELHTRYKIEPVNTRMHRRAKKTWEKLQEIDETLCDKSMEQIQNETGITITGGEECLHTLRRMTRKRNIEPTLYVNIGMDMNETNLRNRATSETGLTKT